MSRRHVFPAERLIEILDRYTTYRTDGHPVRTRKYINGVLVQESDARMIRRWRSGGVVSVTNSTARRLLRRYKLDPKEYYL